MPCAAPAAPPQPALGPPASPVCPPPPRLPPALAVPRAPTHPMCPSCCTAVPPAAPQYGSNLVPIQPEQKEDFNFPAARGFTVGPLSCAPASLPPVFLSSCLISCMLASCLIPALPASGSACSPAPKACLPPAPAPACAPQLVGFVPVDSIPRHYYMGVRGPGRACLFWLTLLPASASPGARAGAPRCMLGLAACLSGMHFMRACSLTQQPPTAPCRSDMLPCPSAPTWWWPTRTGPPAAPPLPPWWRPCSARGAMPSCASSPPPARCAPACTRAGPGWIGCTRGSACAACASLHGTPALPRPFPLSRLPAEAGAVPGARGGGHRHCAAAAPDERAALPGGWVGG